MIKLVERLVLTSLLTVVLGVAHWGYAADSTFEVENNRKFGVTAFHDISDPNDSRQRLYVQQNLRLLANDSERWSYHLIKDDGDCNQRAAITAFDDSNKAVGKMQNWWLTKLQNYI